MYQNQFKQVMNVRLLYYGTNKCKLTELFPTINQTTIIHDNKNGTCMLINVAIPGDRNVIK